MSTIAVPIPTTTGRARRLATQILTVAACAAVIAAAAYGLVRLTAPTSTSAVGYAQQSCTAWTKTQTDVDPAAKVADGNRAGLAAGRAAAMNSTWQPLVDAYTNLSVTAASRAATVAAICAPLR